MRPMLSLSELPGRAVGILGLGDEGMANLRACRARGTEPMLVDDDPASKAPGESVLATANGGPTPCSGARS